MDSLRRIFLITLGVIFLAVQIVATFIIADQSGSTKAHTFVLVQLWLGVFWLGALIVMSAIGLQDGDLGSDYHSEWGGPREPTGQPVAGNPLLWIVAVGLVVASTITYLALRVYVGGTVELSAHEWDNIKNEVICHMEEAQALCRKEPPWGK